MSVSTRKKTSISPAAAKLCRELCDDARWEQLTNHIVERIFNEWRSGTAEARVVLAHEVDALRRLTVLVNRIGLENMGDHE